MRHVVVLGESELHNARAAHRIGQRGFRVTVTTWLPGLQALLAADDVDCVVVLVPSQEGDGPQFFNLLPSGSSWSPDEAAEALMRTAPKGSLCLWDASRLQ